MSAVTTEDTESSWVRAPGEELVPGYLAWSRLGGGTHCETWLAWSAAHWCPVTVKLPRPAEISDADTRSDLALEARQLNRITHPGVQRLVAENLEEAVPHLVLEYVEGPTLASLLDTGPLSATDTVLVGLQVASTLRHLHGLRLVHLDVKPGNVIIREGRAVLIDFGITTAVGTAFPADDAPGTPGFMASELFEGREIDARTDTFALGATLQRCLGPAAEVETGLADALRRMSARDADQRPDDDMVLRLLAGRLPAQHPGLWPAWAAPHDQTG